MELGHRIPGAPGAMQAVTELEYDQRYYVMVRGWLMYQPQGDMGTAGIAGSDTRDHKGAG